MFVEDSIESSQFEYVRNIRNHTKLGVLLDPYKEAIEKSI